MSIIHDALKKLQQGSPPKTDGSNVSPSTTPPPDPPSPFEAVSGAETLPLSDQQGNGKKNPLLNKIKSVLALLCALAISLGACVFLLKQIHRYFPKIERLAMSPIEQLIHKIEQPYIKTKAPENLPLSPLAQITVTPPKPLSAPKPPNPSKPEIAPGPANPPAIPDLPKPAPAVTLDIHGVMSNGSNNLVLINDQVYQEGDDIDGVKIVKIDLDYITVINNGKIEKIRVKN